MQENKPSSIGIAGEYVVDGVNNRLRLPMADKLIDTEEDLVEILKSSENQQNVEDIDSQSMRLTIRFIAKKGLICGQLLEKLGYGDIEIESVSNFSGKNEGLCLVYLGKNAEQRNSHFHKEILEYEQSIVEAVSCIECQSYSKMADTFTQKNEGFNVEILSKPVQKDVLDIVELYKNSYYNPKTQRVEYPFELDEKNVTEMLSSDTNIVGIIRDKCNKIVSVGIGEVMETNLLINGQTSAINIMEISDSATYLSYDKDGNITTNFGGRGFNKRLVLEVIKSGLEKYGDNFDMVFGEVRAALDSVNYLAQKTGRSYAGTLKNAVIINGLLSKTIDPKVREAIRQHPYGDLNVMSMNNARIKEIYS